MYEWIYMGSEDAGLDSVAEDITGLGGVTAEWKETGWGYGWVIECDDEDYAEAVQTHMTKEGFGGNLYRV
jgi:hypothetical protein